MIPAWNNNVMDVFKPGFITFLDEIMFIWFNKWTCPGWMCVPPKPHPFGNEWHDINCGLCKIIFSVELSEGRYHPKDLPKDPTNACGATCGLLLLL